MNCCGPVFVPTLPTNENAALAEEPAVRAARAIDGLADEEFEQ